MKGMPSKLEDESKPNTPERDPNSNGKLRGELTEARVRAKLLEEGYVVSEPNGESAHYDYVVDDEQDLYRAQVKTGRLERDDAGVQYIQSDIKRYQQGSQGVGYTDDQLDVYLIYCHELDALLWIPYGDAPDHNMRLHVETDRPRHSRRNYVADYEI